MDIALTLQDSSTPAREHIKLPNLKATLKAITPCQNSRCATCKTHMICSNAFKCTRTGTSYPVRHHCTCATSNVIYLITCTKCHKQYVGMTTRQLNTRINQHRTNIIRKIPIYISKHFNLPNHSLENLKVQPIDRAASYEELKDL